MLHSLSCRLSSLAQTHITFSSILDNVESLKVNSGFSKRSWAVPTDFIPESPDAETVLHRPPNDTSTVVNILPYILNASPNTFYRLQGYWRPYFDGWYNFSVNSDLPYDWYEYFVEQDNRTVKFCSGAQTWYVVGCEISNPKLPYFLYLSP
jgi:hypothetical protein